MRVEIAGYAWLDRSTLTDRQVSNIVTRLTIQPKQTSDIAQAETPAPIHLYRLDEARNLLGVPRGFYRHMGTGAHEEVLKVGWGAPMRKLATTARFEGPFAEQAEAIEALLAALYPPGSGPESPPWGGALLQAQPAFGKALVHGEPVLTDSGWKPIERIIIGDLVAGTDGAFHCVTGVYPQGVRQAYRVTFTDGTFVDCDGDHIWTLVLRRKKGMPSIDIKTSDLMIERLSNTYNKIKQRCFWLPNYRAVEWPSESLPIDPYTLGVFLGNGHWSTGAVMATILDDEILGMTVLPEHDRWMRCSHQNAGKATTYRCSPNRSDSQRFPSLRTYLIDLGLEGCDSHSKFIPDRYMRGRSADRLSLLQGLFDTDGYAISSGLIEYTTVSHGLAFGVQEIVCSLGGTCVLVPRRTRYTRSDGTKSDWFPSFRLTIKLPRAMEPFRLARKQAVVNRAAWQRSLGRAVDSVVPIGFREATCISVDSPDHLYLTRNCVPTHNTVVSLEVARRLSRRTLILVHQEFFLDQWRKRIQQFLPEARIGIIQQDRCEYARTKTGEAPDFVIGLLQSLARDTGNRYPREMYEDAFGLVIGDEIHRVGAQSWSDIIPRFNAAYRLGLTATPRRKDGAEDVFFHHIAPVTYRATTESVKPKLRKIITTTELRGISRGDYKVSVDQLNSAQIINQVCLDTFRTQAIVDDLVQAVQIGRKIMVVSARLDHLRDMADRTGQALFNLNLPFVPIQDFYTGQWFSHEVWDTTTKAHRKGEPKMVPREQADLDRAERANVIFATQQMVLEGLDIPALDVLLLATPISDVEQAAGRVRRWCLPEPRKCEHYCPWRAGKCKGKPTPIIVDVMDLRIPRLRGMAARREKFYKTCCTM